MPESLRATVWNEYRHEKRDKVVAKIYPEGMHKPIAEHLRSEGFDARTATLDEPEHGLTEEVLAQTDVLIWWGHAAHREVRDEIIDRIHERVLDGMGLILLHSACFSKISTKLMGTTGNLKWRKIGEKERIWVIEPGHLIAEGLDEYFEIPNTEMYGEHFDMPAPDKLVFISWFEGGEVFRSGCCYHRGKGKVFYFRPGHETYPIYHQPEVLMVIANGVRWAAPVAGPPVTFGERPEPLEQV